MTSDSYLTGGGIRVHRTVEPILIANAIEPIVDALDARRGVLLASSYEYPGRYTRWDMGSSTRRSRSSPAAAGYARRR